MIEAWTRGFLQWPTLYLITFSSVTTQQNQPVLIWPSMSFLTRWKQKPGRRNWLTSLHSFLFWHELTDNQGVVKVKEGQGSHVSGHDVLQHNSQDDGIWRLDLSVSLTCCFGLNNTSMTSNKQQSRFCLAASCLLLPCQHSVTRTLMDNITVRLGIFLASSAAKLPLFLYWTIWGH